MVAISVDTAEESQGLITARKLSFPIASDPDMTAIIAYGLAMEGRDISVPATFIIAPDRRILHRYVGEDMTDRPNLLEIVQMTERYAAELRPQ